MRILRIQIQFRIPNTDLHETFKEYSNESLTKLYFYRTLVENCFLVCSTTAESVKISNILAEMKRNCDHSNIFLLDIKRPDISNNKIFLKYLMFVYL
jgi:hypothetical protein